MRSSYSDKNIERSLLTLESIQDTISKLLEWNGNINSVSYYYSSPAGMQLLAANCTLITAIGEGVNRINRLLPDFLQTSFPKIPWKSIVGMRNKIAHGYFELDADAVYETIIYDIPQLKAVIDKAVGLLKEDSRK